MSDRLSLAQMMSELDRREASDKSESDALLGRDEVLAGSEKYAEIRLILNANPILVQPCLAWLKDRLGLIALSQLRVLYSDEQIAEMQKANVKPE